MSERMNGITVWVAPDRASATVVVPEDVDAEALTIPSLASALVDAGVVVGDEVRDRLERLIAECASDPGAREVVVAEAQPATAGADARIEWVAGYDPDGPGRDMEYAAVSVGDPIATLVPPTDGLCGTDVTGEAVPASPGATRPIHVDADSLDVDETGVMTATVDGVVLADAGGIRIVPLRLIAGDVDETTGDVDFEGCVHIRKDLRDGRTVKSRDGLWIDGTIGAAAIVAGGDLVIGGDAIDCEMIVGGALRCEEGRIAGGPVTVAGPVMVHTLGIDGDDGTLLVLGAAPIASPRMQRLEQLVEKLSGRLEQDETELETLSKRRDELDHSETERLTEIEFEAAELREKLDACRGERDGLRAGTNARFSVDLSVSACVHAGVSIQVGDSVMRVAEDLHGPLRIVWDAERRLRIEGPGDEVRLLADVAPCLRRAA